MLTADNLAKINLKRRGTKYNSTIDAVLVKGSSLKADLNDDPTLRYFHAGINKDGYWNSSHAKVQLEDFTDCITILYPHFDITYLYDQSSGHTKLRPDGLSANNMNIVPGGAVSSM